MGNTVANYSTNNNKNIARKIQEECSNKSTSDRENLIIAFGSCNEETNKKQPLWKVMKELNPDCYLLLGDNIYVDQKIKFMGVGYDEKPPREFDFKYNILLNHPQFIIGPKQQIASNYYPLVMATWDDHDFGEDNADGSYPYKEDSKNSFMKFHKALDPTNRLSDKFEEMSKKDRGIYYYYDLCKNNVRVRIVMFDVRYHRTKKNILGDEQKKWFEDVISSVTPKEFDWLILCSGSCFGFNASGFLPSEGVEKWDLKSWKWLKNLLRKQSIKSRTLLLSGDIHCSVVHVYTNNLFEFTSSSLTHSIGKPIALIANSMQISKHRKTEVININSFGCLNLFKNYWEFGCIDKHKNSYLNLSNTISIDINNIRREEEKEKEKEKEKGRKDDDNDDNDNDDDNDEKKWIVDDNNNLIPIPITADNKNQISQNNFGGTNDDDDDNNKLKTILNKFNIDEREREKKEEKEEEERKGEREEERKEEREEDNVPVITGDRIKMGETNEKLPYDSKHYKNIV